jgi:hypothetical protein
MTCIVQQVMVPGFPKLLKTSRDRYKKFRMLDAVHTPQRTRARPLKVIPKQVCSHTNELSFTEIYWTATWTISGMVIHDY